MHRDVQLNQHMQTHTHIYIIYANICDYIILYYILLHYMCVSGIIHLSATLSPPTHSLQGTMAEGLNEKCSSPSSCDTSDTRSVTIIPHRHKKVQKKLYGYLLAIYCWLVVYLPF